MEMKRKKKNVNEKKNGDDKISCLQSIQFQKYDIIVDIFSSLDSGMNGEKRMQRMKKWNTLLCDDGWYINECFAPRHHIVRTFNKLKKNEILVNCVTIIDCKLSLL